MDEQSWRQFDRLAFMSRQPTSAGLGGEHRSRARAPSTDFADYRAYQPGDDFRRVDWNVYGRLGSLQVKVTEARERQNILLVLDCSSSMNWGEPNKLAYSAQVTATLAYVGLQRADVVRIATLGQQPRLFGPVSGRARFPEVVRFMAGVEPDGRVDLAEQLANLLSTLPPRPNRAQPMVLFVSDLLTADLSALGRAFDGLMSRGADLVLIHVLSPQEETPAPEGEVELVDAETGDIVEVGLGVEVISRYRERLAQWQSSVEALCVERGLRYSRARTDQPVESLLLDDLRRIQVLS
jgi:uncharacterized protein (DUF58 family)